jgi:ribosomal protein S18 acetylase RimI-like enzyme
MPSLMLRPEDCKLRMSNANMQSRIALRPGQADDFDFCARLYFAGMEQVIRELRLDMAKHAVGLRERWHPTEVRIITLDGTDAGWLQSRIDNDAVFLAQLFIDAPLQGQGVGTEIMTRLIGEAAQSGRAVTLGVVKTNPALRLYERLGFRTTHDDERKFYMRREAGTSLGEGKTSLGEGKTSLGEGKTSRALSH